MDKIKEYILALFAIMLMIAGFTVYIYANMDKTEEVYSIAIIVDDTNTDRWRTLRQGIDLAAKDNKVEITFSTIGRRMSVNEQNDMIDMQMSNGADAVIVDLADSSYMKNKMTQISYQIPVLYIETGVDSEELVPVIEADYRSMGKELAQAVLKANGKKQKIGIVVGNDKKLSNRECLEGVRTALEQAGAAVLWELREEDNLKYQVAEQMKEAPADILITLENAATEAAIDYNLEWDKTAGIYGIGNTEKAVYYLDRQEVKTLVVPDEFTMGYLSVDMMSRKLKYGSSLEHGSINYNVVTKENLYSDENQKMLFPIAQ